ncbi:MAG: M48 family metallopeptidase [Lentisphaeria bacterium]|nr:M48 family metallopeptidase [Lentisphaeria bacterium]
MNWTYAVFAMLLFFWALDLVVEILNLRQMKSPQPKRLQGLYDEASYSKSQAYNFEKVRIGLFSSTLSTFILLTAIQLGWLNDIDEIVQSIFSGEISRGLAFGGILMVASSLLSLPFSFFNTFVIEERYGFNRSDLKTWIMDRIKGLILGALFGAALFSLLIWFFSTKAIPYTWLIACISFIFIQLLLMFLMPVLIMPLFNKFTPLEEGELKEMVLDYANKENFALSGLFTMDGSKRSSKANAFFTGFGKFKRIVLFDTLVNNFSNKELLAILAHEMGHFKKKHIIKQMLLMFLNTGLMFYFLNLILKNPLLFDAFNIQTERSVYVSLILAIFLFQPISFILSIGTTILSRKYEYEADEYAARTTGLGNELIDALKKLSVDSLSNLTPHPLKVFLEFSHPTLLQRWEVLEKKGLYIEERDLEDETVE